MSDPPDLDLAIARTERALQDALNALRMRVAQGKRDQESRALITRCHDLADALRAACARLGTTDDERATRAAVDYLVAHLVILEREVDQVPLH